MISFAALPKAPLSEKFTTPEVMVTLPTKSFDELPKVRLPPIPPPESEVSPFAARVRFPVPVSCELMLKLLPLLRPAEVMVRFAAVEMKPELMFLVPSSLKVMPAG